MYIQLYILPDRFKYCCNLKCLAEILEMKYLSVLILYSQIRSQWLFVDHELTVIQPKGWLKYQRYSFRSYESKRLVSFFLNKVKNIEGQSTCLRELDQSVMWFSITASLCLKKIKTKEVVEQHVLQILINTSIARNGGILALASPSLCCYQISMCLLSEQGSECIHSPWLACQSFSNLLHICDLWLPLSCILLRWLLAFDCQNEN